MATKTIHISGKRKKAIARATIREGKGIVRINSQNLEVYNPSLARERIKEPLLLAPEIAEKVNISVKVNGGGWQSQADSIRLAIARGLVEFSKSKQLKQKFIDYDRNLIIADVRRNEPCKPNDSGKPRAKRQFSKR